ncbi:MAG: alpha/beta hydrolase fold domain-containing protein [Actinomycetota bacterium]|nr:alpha/beta hydrolase fold domain-containing protein [Actinomycetota bacterium]
MSYDPLSDQRLDPRIKTFLSMVPVHDPIDATSREAMLAETTTPEALSAVATSVAFTELCDNEEVAPSNGLRFHTFEVESSPDANTILLQTIRPDNDEKVACVYYIHGGAMATLSSFYGNYRAWARIVAAQGVAVVLVEFRNSILASKVPEVAPYPAGLNDCVAGLRWTHDHADLLGIDPGRITVAGESGGGNLTLATALALKRDGNLELVRGLYALCPFITGMWPDERFPSSIENDGIFIYVRGNRGAMGYGMSAYDAHDPLAWPGFATADDVAGFPPTVISVNECDPLRDEGIAFYRLLLSAGVSARARQVMGTMHATELIPILCPEITRDTARDLAAFARS